MKNLLLMTGVSVLGLSAFAEDLPLPEVIENSNANAISANARYVVADGYSGVKIYDLETNQSYDYSEGSPKGKYEAGFANCVSSNGIVIGYGDYGTQYWMDGIWHKLKVPSNTVGSVLVNSITSDGSRICGSLGIANIGPDDKDILRQVPCIWNWNSEKEEFDLPIMLPHPEKDFSGRIPQLITAVGISEDGKTVIGQIVVATGTVRYPIIYKENENGEWSYSIPDEAILNPAGVVFPDYPGDDGPAVPAEEAFMTQSEIEQYLEAFDAYVDSGYTIPAPEYQDFMTPEEIAAFDAAMDAYNAFYDNWIPWWNIFYKVIDKLPDYEYNSIRLSPDGKKYACTVIEEFFDPIANIVGYAHVWVFDIESGEITKYNQKNDFTLTYMANDGIALAVTDLHGGSEAYVLKDGVCNDMQTWISTRIPEYGPWIEENMLEGVDVAIFDEELGEEVYVYEEKVLTGRPSATPDLSVIALGVTNVWDSDGDGKSYIFNMKGNAAVSTLKPNETENSIYDLSGRKLRHYSAPGIYIVNGEKKVVR